ncbi:MAG: aspartyl beta-hydroxylase [Betaproteobacteria bacterium TMED82]|nr:MAG: aspartyl beta-hydroxylase [Betaproteobacteria bacterium TMED82]
MVKGIIISLWISSILFFYFRGKIKPSLAKTLIDHSVLLAPLNAIFVMTSKTNRTPVIPTDSLSELKILRDNWHIFREEAIKLAKAQQIQKSEKKDDVGFNSFFKYGWKRFYLKWYGENHPSAETLCPNSVKLLKAIPSIKAAMFAELPPGGRLNPHRDPYAGSLRYHLGLITPNSTDCYILVDGEKYSWKDGEDILFDETYVHQARNNTDISRIILFCDVERPQKYLLITIINRLFGRYIISAASSPNRSEDKTGFINKITGWYWAVDSFRRKLKNWSKTVYYATKALVISAILLLIIII